MQDYAARRLDRNPLGDDVVEADEMNQNAGEKGIEHPRTSFLRDTRAYPGGIYQIEP
jgi:hypothetical protein